MELKVWVDGIQRVVCGVSSQTTCQDVVIALAHATGQTGRFTLIEKWRSNTRLLAPSEKPALILREHGEYSNDVQFHLKKTAESSSKLVSPNASLTPTRIAEFQRNMGSNGSFSHKSGVENNNRRPQDSLLPVIAKDQTIVHPEDSQQFGGTESPLSGSLTKPVTNPNHRPRQPPTYDQALARSNYFQSNGSLLASNASSVSPAMSSSSSSNNMTVPTKKPSQQNSDPSLPPPSTAAKIDNSAFRSSENNKRRHPINGSPLASPSSCPSSAVKQQKPSSTESPHRVNQTSTDPSQRTIYKEIPKSTSKSPRDPLNLISGLQRNVLLKENLMELDNEPVYGTRQDMVEKDVAFREQMKRMEDIWLNSQAELEKLQDEFNYSALESLKEEQNKIQSEKKKLTSKANELDAQIAVCRQKIQSLMAQIADEKHRIEVEQRDQELAEEQVRQKTLNDIKEQIKETNQQIDDQAKELDALNAELKQLDELLQVKHDEMESVAKDIRKENIAGLSIENSSSLGIVGVTGLMSASKLPDASENAGPQTGLYNRIGSTRKMVGYPRELRNAVATTKNPNGVWV
ncbi:Ras association domain-containing protein 8 [Halotydeus destructor]|nr:Ras association domain-containing protein 8 [Halotydeus destructor]